MCARKYFWTEIQSCGLYACQTEPENAVTEQIDVGVSEVVCREFSNITCDLNGALKFTEMVQDGFELGQI